MADETISVRRSTVESALRCAEWNDREGTMRILQAILSPHHGGQHRHGCTCWICAHTPLAGAGQGAKA